MIPSVFASQFFAVVGELANPINGAATWRKLGLCDFNSRRTNWSRRKVLLGNNLRRTSRKHRALASGLKRVRFAQLNKGNRTQFDPPVIPTGRRLKTSACLRFYAVFSRVCTRWPSLKLSPARCLYQPRRESSWVLYLPLATRLSGVSKSRDPEVIEKSRTS
jgi:hypothetical protein